MSFDPFESKDGVWPLPAHRLWDDPPQQGDYIIILHHSGGAWDTEFDLALYRPSPGYYWIPFPAFLPTGE